MDRELRAGQTWSVWDSRLGARRRVRILDVDSDQDDPTARVTALNPDSGRHTHPLIQSIRARWRLEAEES